MLDIPTVWSNITIVARYFKLNTPQDFDSMMKVTNTWLSRAKGLPCFIEIDFTKPYGDNEPLWKMDWHENIVRDLISLHKFKKLGVAFADHHLRDLLQLPNDKLSCIEDLCLQYISPNQAEIANPTSPLDLVHKLSNLTSFSLLPSPFDVELHSGPLEGYSKFAGIPWYNLRHISLCVAMPAPFCLDALEHCSAARPGDMFSCHHWRSHLYIIATTCSFVSITTT
ncbi:hypothetical protein M378DRAFT_156679 [Amanita muscaria Koide BX008]|uniref:Uncharacterized protein n=1 Tax=Amanita muscaria (strain Koide BX008) TaxID=946122 RepID=A0A0C2T3U6_AMAMK|nr:hypothetical protein M378DRAFT_156679 [Amanita muscaria Koide BX008]